MEEETQTENNLQAKIEDANQMVADGVPMSVVLKIKKCFVIVVEASILSHWGLVFNEII